MNSTIFYTNGTSKPIVPENGFRFTYDEIRKMVGGYIQTVRAGDGIILVDEDGKLKGLPINKLATEKFKDKLWDGDCFVGNVLFVKDSEIFD